MSLQMFGAVYDTSFVGPLAPGDSYTPNASFAPAAPSQPSAAIEAIRLAQQGLEYAKAQQAAKVAGKNPLPMPSTMMDRGGKTNYVPYIIGAVALAAIGGLLLKRK